MKRRTLDIVIAAGGLLLAVLIAVLGLALAGQSAFATEYVKSELGAQKIVFPAASALTPEDTGWKAGSTCLVAFAGQAMETGAQAECYAKYYIRHHMNTSGVTAGLPGATYATVGTAQGEQRTIIAAAIKSGDKAAQDAAQKKLDS